MNLVMAMSCIQMKLLPEEAINAATINGAFAMEADKQTGSIAIGKKSQSYFYKAHSITGVPALCFWKQFGG